MASNAGAAAPPSEARPSRLGRVGLAVGAAFVLIVAAFRIHAHTLGLLATRPLSPRWDHAAHLVTGWTDAYFLTTGRLGALVADLWSQGYWPPGLSLFQMPFFVVFGPALTSGLWASLAAFLVLGGLGVWLMIHESPRAPGVATAGWLLFLVTSPFALAYASIGMMEMPGLAAHALVIAAYAHDQRRRTAASATAFAIALSLCFFVKYNYFVLIAAPLLVHEYLVHTAGQTRAVRMERARAVTRAWLASPSGVVVTAYVLFAVAIEVTGGFAFDLAGRRVAVRTIGYSAHPVLYGLLLRLWYLHRRRRIDWAALWARDRRLRALVLWWGVPVTAWLVSPYPNHIKDVAYLLFNTPMGPPTASASLNAYLRAAAVDYFGNAWSLALCLGAFVWAVVTYTSRPPLARLLLLAALLEFALVTVHPTRDPRFLAHSMLALWLASALEIGAWLSRTGMATSSVVTLSMGVVAIAGVGSVLDGAAFARLSVEHYVESAALREAWRTIRAGLGPDGRAAVLGRRDAVSPGLVRWELGPPSGQAAFPTEIQRVADVPALEQADAVVLVAPHDEATPSTVESAELARDEARLRPALTAGRLRLTRELPVRDAGITLRVYEPTRP